MELFEDLYHYVAASTEMVGQVLAGHLAIEFLLRKLMSQYDPKLAAHVDELSHARLIALSRDVGVLSVERAQVLVQVNALRNRYAHVISYYPEVSEIAVIFSTAELAFTDYSDGIKEGLVELGSAKKFQSAEQVASFRAVPGHRLRSPSGVRRPRWGRGAPLSGLDVSNRGWGVNGCDSFRAHRTMAIQESPRATRSLRVRSQV